jgi:hypothetical protein
MEMTTMLRKSLQPTRGGALGSSSSRGLFAVAASARLSSLGLTMRRWLFIILGLLIPMVARANPYVLNPSSLIAFGVVSVFALVVEAGIVALLLTFAGLAPIRFFIGFLLANIAVFLFVFWPLQRRLPLPALEALVVLIDATSIWLLSRVPALQGDSYRRVSWVFAGIASLIGNAASFCIGVMASGEPWKTHGTGE